MDFKPGELLGCVSGGLGLRRWLESGGHRFIVTSDKDGSDSEFERHLPEAHIVISQPFWPAYLTPERLAKATKLKLALTAGIGSDHVALDAAMARRIDVAEVTFCNSISVAEHVVMQILALVRSFVPGHDIIRSGGWHIADAVQRAYDLEGASPPHTQPHMPVQMRSRACTSPLPCVPAQGCMWARWQRAASAWRCCAASSPST